MAGDITQSTPNAFRLLAELEFLTELSRVVASNTELQPILDWIVQKTTAMLRAEEGSIRLLTPDMQNPVVFTLIRTPEAPGMSSGSWPQAIGTTVMGYLMTKGEPLATQDLPADPRFSGLRNEQTRIRSVLAVPLKVDNRFTGMLAVTHSSPGRQWKSDEVQMLSIVAANSASVIEQARLRAAEMEKRRLEEEQRLIERELGLARDIQMGLLPSTPLRLGAWEARGRVVPARQVGGDSYDYFPLSDERIAVAIADVSGKGVPAALLMANVQASLRAFCNGRWSIPEAMQHVNESVVRTAATGKFVTMFYGELDVRDGSLRYSNAGHNYPLLRRGDGTLVELKEGGLPLGIRENTRYDQGELALAPGDGLLLFSDGISEALDGRGLLFGDERLRELWRATADSRPGPAIDRVMSQVEAFRGGATQSDDMTVVVVGPRSDS